MITGFTSSNYVYKVSLRYIFQRDGALFGLLTLLNSFRKFKTANPLDKVYALLGLAADSSDFMEPDYTFSISRVYGVIAQTLIQRNNTLDILKYSGISFLTAIDPLDLPSWIANWQSTPEAIYLNLEAYRAARQTKAMIRFSSQRLLAHGVLHGRICYLESIILMLPTKKSQLPSIFRT